MIINGIDIEPSKIVCVYMACKKCDGEPLAKVGVKLKDNSEICVGRFWNRDEADSFARGLEDRLQAAREQEEEVVDGVTFDKVEKRLSSRYITMEVKEIDALFESDTMIYLLKGNSKYSLIQKDRSIKRLASYCNQLTEINGVYVNLDKVKGFFVNENTVDCDIFVACNDVLLIVAYTKYFEDAVKHRDELCEKYGVK